MVLLKLAAFTLCSLTSLPSSHGLVVSGAAVGAAASPLPPPPGLRAHSRSHDDVVGSSRRHRCFVALHAQRGGGGGGGGGGGLDDMPRVDRWAFVRRRVKEQLLPIGLLLAITVGIMFPSLGVAAGKFAVTNYLAAGIFFIGGMKLRTEEARNALNNLPAILWGTCSILLVSAVLGTRVNNVFPLTVPEFSLGIALFVCMPCTINSGAALAAQSGGNFALALLLTLISSILGVFVVPFLLNNLTYFGASVSLPIKEMVVKLCTTVLLPLFLGKGLVVASKTVKGEVKRRGELLGLVSNVLIIMTPWIQISRSAQRDVFSAVTPAELLAVVSLGSFIHIIFLIMNFLVSGMLRLSTEIRKSIVFVASSKTLPLALAVLAILPPGFGDKGLIALPCILGHFSQIVIDSFLVANWKSEKRG